MCEAVAVARGLCRRHYSQQRRGRLAPDGPQSGDPSGFGRYGVIDRDEWAIACHECGAQFPRLAAHLTRDHGMTVAQYRARHGLPRTVGLVSEHVSRTLSEEATARVGSPGWQRLEAKRDPAMASSARGPEALRAPAVRQHAADLGRELADRQRGAGADRTCPACGRLYRGRRRACSDACASILRANGARSQPRARAATDSEVEQLRAATRDPGPVVRRLQAAGVSSRSIAAAFGRAPSWVSTRWPLSL